MDASGETVPEYRLVALDHHRGGQAGVGDGSERAEPVLGPFATQLTASVARGIELSEMGAIANTKLVFSITYIDLYRQDPRMGPWIEKAIEAGQQMGYELAEGAEHAEINTLMKIIGQSGRWVASAVTSSWNICPSCRVVLSDYASLTLRIVGLTACII